MAIKNPAHPGRIIKNACLDPLGLSVTAGAKALEITRQTLTKIVNGHSGISAEMTIWLEKAGWSNADHWLRMQAAYDLAQARKTESKIKIYRQYIPRELALT